MLQSSNSYPFLTFSDRYTSTLQVLPYSVFSYCQIFFVQKVVARNTEYLCHTWYYHIIVIRNFITAHKFNNLYHYLRAASDTFCVVCEPLNIISSQINVFFYLISVISELQEYSIISKSQLCYQWYYLLIFGPVNLQFMLMLNPFCYCSGMKRLIRILKKEVQLKKR